MGLGEVLQIIGASILVVASLGITLMGFRIILRHLMRNFREGMIGELSWYRIVPESRSSADTNSSVPRQVEAIRSFCDKLSESRYINRGVASVVWNKGDDGLLRLFVGLDRSHVSAGFSAVKTLAEGLNCRAEEMKSPPNIPSKGMVVAHRSNLSPSSVKAAPEELGQVASTLSDIDSVSGCVVMTIEMMTNSESKRFEYHMTESAVMRGGLGNRYSSDTSNKASIISGTAVRTSIGAVSNNGNTTNAVNLLKLVVGEIGSKGIKAEPVEPISYYRSRAVLWALPVAALSVGMFLLGLPASIALTIAAGPILVAVLSVVLPDFMYGRWFRDRLTRGEVAVPPYVWVSLRFWIAGTFNAMRSDTDGPTIVNPIAHPSHPQVVTMYSSPLAEYMTMPDVTEAINIATENVPMRGFPANYERSDNDDIFCGFSGTGQETNYSLQDLAYGSFILGAPDSGKTNYLQIQFLGASLLSCKNSFGVSITPLWVETKGEGAYKSWSMVRDMPGAVFVDAHNPLSGTRLALEGRRISEGATVAEVLRNCGTLIDGMQYSYGDGIQGSSREALDFSLRIALLLTADEIRFLDVDHRVEPEKPNVIELAYYVIGGDETIQLGARLKALREQLDQGDQDERTYYLSEAIGTMSPYLDPNNRAARDRKMAPLNKLSELRNAREFWTPSSHKQDVYISSIPGQFAPIVMNMGPYWEPELNAFSTNISKLLARRLTLAMNFILWDFVQANCSGWKEQGKLVPAFYDEVADIAVNSENSDLPNVMAEVAKEGRSRGFAYHCAAQNLVQIPDMARHQVMAFRTIISFLLPNIDDANPIIKNMGRSFYVPKNLQHLPQGIAVVSRMKNRDGSIEAFTMSVPEAYRWKEYISRLDSKVDSVRVYGEEVYFANKEEHVQLEGAGGP